MNLITMEGLKKSFSERMLFDDASFYMDEGEKVGVVGINGTGKSTLLKLVAGLCEPDDGTITIGNNKVIRFLFQQPIFIQGQSVIEHVMQDVPRDEEYWSLEAKAKALLGELEVDFNEPDILALSGGQRKKVALVRVLLGKTDLLILDEPTNHLDGKVAECLENYLKGFRGAVLMVTHDRYFLEAVSDRIVEIDKGKIYSYKTNYSGFLELKAQREEMAASTDLKLANLLRNEQKWVMRGAKARSTKQKARLLRYEELKNRKKQAADDTIELSSVYTRLGRTTVELRGVSKAFGNKTVIKDFGYIFLKNDRIGFIGPNGSGKTTLMKLITGELLPDFGEIITGQTVKLGYYAQEISTSPEDGIRYMNPELRVIDYIRNTAEYVNTTEGMLSASQMLDKFLFPPAEQYALIGRLSGGEKRRLNLLRVLMEAPNVLILDEPTNDLDIATLTILENYLDNFEGIVITVSHDRYFLDRVVKRIFAFEGDGNIRRYEGNYTDYSIIREFENDASMESMGEKANREKTARVHDRKIKFTYEEQREFETIEDDIALLEKKIAETENEITANSRDFVKLNELSEKKRELEEKLDRKMDRWTYLMELDELIKQTNGKG